MSFIRAKRDSDRHALVVFLRSPAVSSFSYSTIARRYNHRTPCVPFDKVSWFTGFSENYIISLSVNDPSFVLSERTVCAYTNTGASDYIAQEYFDSTVGLPYSISSAIKDIGE